MFNEIAVFIVFTSSEEVASPRDERMLELSVLFHAIKPPASSRRTVNGRSEKKQRAKK